MRKITLLLSLLLLFAIQSLFAQVKSEKYLRSEELAKLGMYEDASKLLEELCLEEPNNYLYFQDLGYSYLNIFDFDAAIKNYTTAITLNKDCYKCYSHLARAYFEKGDFSTAEVTVAKGFAISDTTAHLHMTRGLIYQQTNRGDLALADFTKAISLTPDDKDYYILRANYYLAIGEAYNAYSDITSAIKLDPINSEYYYYRAYILTNLNVQDEALNDIDKAIKLKNTNADYFNLKFTIHMNRKEYDFAEQAVLKSIEIKPNDYYAYVSLGDLYMQMNNIERYCDAYQKAIDLHPDKNSEDKANLILHHDKYCNENRMPYYFVRSLGFYNDSNYGDCILITENGIAITGASSILYNMKGSAHLSRLEYEKAEIEFNNSLSTKDMLLLEVKDFYSQPLNDTDAGNVAKSYIVKSEFGLATIKLIMHDYDNALTHIIKAVDMAEFITNFDGIEFLYNTKGMIYLAKNDLDNALKNFNIADEKNPYNSISKLNISMVSILKSTKYNAKKLQFEYIPELLSPRLILPAMKLTKTDNLEELKNALEICDSVISFESENALAYLFKAKISQLLGDSNYCEAALNAREFGIYNAIKEIGGTCK